MIFFVQVSEDEENQSDIDSTLNALSDKLKRHEQRLEAEVEAEKMRSAQLQRELEEERHEREETTRREQGLLERLEFLVS